MELPIYILLASYNGERYIKEQLESLINQTYKNWRLLIRDDGSTDATIFIIKKYIGIDQRIKLVDEEGLNKGKGACQNFSALMKIALQNELSFIMFCDQDDYWFPNKIELMLNEIVKTNSQLVYSDFLYADSELKQLPAEIQKSKSPFMFPLFRNLIVQNQVYGCTMIINNDLARSCIPIPDIAENHDYWISLVASGIGAKICHLKEALMLYRQHANNVTGSFKDHYLLPRIKRFLFSFDVLAEIESRKILMLMTLYQSLANELTIENKKLLEGYLKALKKNKINIILYCIKNKIKRQSFISTIVYFIVLCNLNKQKIINK